MRHRFKLTIQDLADEAYVSRRSILRWEADDGTPTQNKLARILNVVSEYDRESALRMLDALDLPRDVLPPPMADPRARSSALLVGIVAGADTLDISVKRMRGALAATIATWRAAGLSMDDVAAKLTKP